MQRLKELFLQWAGEPCEESMALSGGGSSRHYYRLVGATRHCIGTIAECERENEAFFYFGRHLYGKGMAVPEIYVIGGDRRHYLQEEVGMRSLYDILSEKRRRGYGFDAEMMGMYKRALSDLDAIQKAGRDADFGKAFPRRAFDERAMRWDLNYFKYYYLKLAGIEFDEEYLEDDFGSLIKHLQEADCGYMMYRDFQGRNIMVGEDGRLSYIDFQGARLGAAQYDVVSLLYSAKSEIPPAIRKELLNHYVALHGDENFMKHYTGYTLIRILQTLGAYGYRGLFERKPYFVESIPLALNNLRQVVEENGMPVEMPELERVVRRMVEGQTSMEGGEGNLVVEIESFSYKKGLPEDTSGNGGGHVFDCRALPNPGRYAEYRSYTGRDRVVREFLEGKEAVESFLEHAYAIVAQSVEKYIERRFTHLQVAFGCTGGQHRSVYCAERMAEMVKKRFAEVEVVVKHREQGITY